MQKKKLQKKICRLGFYSYFCTLKSILPFSPDEMFISWRFLDADGHVMHGDMASPIQLDQEAAPGAIGETNFGLGNFSSNANDYYRFGKVSFRTEK